MGVATLRGSLFARPCAALPALRREDVSRNVSTGRLGLALRATASHRSRFLIVNYELLIIDKLVVQPLFVYSINNQ
jgi:hypothetical protein